MNTHKETTEFQPLTISLSPVHLHDIIVLLQDVVPEHESKYSLKRLLVALRQNGYESFEALEEVASKQFRALWLNIHENGLAERYRRNKNGNSDTPPQEN